ncbi:MULTISPECIES: porin [Vibrio]|nr:MULTISPECIES: porin [Vibrio]SJN40440.1 hypothetical protein FM109_17150 [Vibrio casei]
MNKTLLIGALLTAMSSSSYAIEVYNDTVNSLDIYGRAEGQIATGKGSFTGDDTGARMTGRLGFLMGRQLSIIENTRIIGKFEWQLRTETNDTKLDAGEDLEARYNYIGFDNKTWGELIVGRTKNPMYQVMKITDKYKNYTPNIYNYGISSIDTSYTYNRQDSTLQWNSHIDKHQFQVAYVMGNGENGRLDYGIMGSYYTHVKIDQVKITPTFAASQFKRNDDNTDTTRKEHNQAMAGLEVAWQQFTFGVTADYTNIKQNNGEDKYFGLDSIASYQWQKFKLLGGYSFLEERDQDIYEKEDWRIEGQLTLAKKTYLSLTYDKELAASNKKTNNDAITLGLRYDF